MANLTVIQGQDRGKVYDLRGVRIIIGRDPHAEVALTDHSVSRHHAELRVEEGKFHIIDLNSSNGTFVNGVKATDGVVRPGDQIRVGAVILALGRVVTGPTIGGAGPVQIDEEGNVVDAAIQATARGEFDPAAFVEETQDDSHLRRSMENMRTLFKFATSLGAIFSTQQLVDTIMNMIFDVVDADRAFILLTDAESGRMLPVAVRYRDDLIREIEAERTSERSGKNGKSAAGHAGPVAIAGTGAPGASGQEKAAAGQEKASAKPPIHVSRTIVNYCLDRGEGVLSTNAMQDRRFQEGDSVQELGIRSAICVPIKARDKMLGVIHVDTQLQQAPFTPSDLRIMTVLGSLAGLALENTQLVEQALQRERLAAVGEAVASLSHYIKNILQGLQGGDSVIEGALRDGRLDKVGRGWEIVRRNQNRINDLVLDMLHYSRKREPNFQRHSVNAVLREVIELAAPRATEKRAEIVSQLDTELPEIWIDPSGVHHACLNIINNAIDAVQAGHGRVTISTAVEATDSNNKKQTAHTFIITIADNGRGIPESELELIFRAFHSTKGHQGTGLGLAVSKKIIQEHHGAIDVESHPGAGSTFTIKLPIVRPPAGAEDTSLPLPASAANLDSATGGN